MLNEQQKAAAHYSGHAKNILVLAGAGCGKTKTIVSRIEYLIRQGVEPSRILLLTFTNRASKEMMSRISSQAGSGSEYVFAGTFHRFTLSIMSQMPTAFEMSGLNIIDRDDQLSLMSIVRSKHVKKGDKALNESIPKPAELINILSFSRNTCVTPQVYMKKETYLDHDSAMICDAIFSDYRDHKSERGYVDFDDLLSRFVEMLEKKPNLTKQVASAFDHIAVDEMQDTNPVQFRILKLLISEGANLFTVLTRWTMLSRQLLQACSLKRQVPMA